MLCPVDTSTPRWLRLPDDRLLAMPSAVGWITPCRSSVSFVGRVLLLVSHTNCFLVGCRTPWPCNLAPHDIISRSSKSAGSWRSLSALSLVSRLASLPVFTLRVGWILHATVVKSAVSQAMILQATSAASHSLVSFLRCIQAGVTRVRAGQEIETIRPNHSKN